MVEQDYIDITPRGVDDGKGYSGINKTVFQDTEIQQIMNNPDNLTREGILEKIKIWKMSSNRHVVIKYETMLKRCQRIAPSGTTEDGRVIFSRDNNGEPRWYGEAPKKR